MSSPARWIVLGVVLGGTVGLVLSFARPTYCVSGGGNGFDAAFVCSYKSLFLWDAAPIIADAASAMLGALLGGIVGWARSAFAAVASRRCVTRSP